MSKIITINVSGQAEKFFNKMITKGHSESDIISKSLWLLERAIETGRIVEVENFENISEKTIRRFGIGE